MRTERPGDIRSTAAYEIRVEGHLDQRWSKWFAGMTVTCESQRDGSQRTTLAGSVADQASLRGILSRIWDLNLTLVSVIRLDANPRGREVQ